MYAELCLLANFVVYKSRATDGCGALPAFIAPTAVPVRNNSEETKKKGSGAA